MDNEASSRDLASPPKKRRRRYTAAFKARVIAECEHPDASVAGVAIRHGLNPNMVQKWRLIQRRDSQDDFLRLPVPSLPGPQAATRDDPATVRMDVPMPTGTLTVHWPLGALQQSVEWLRALTR